MKARLRILVITFATSLGLSLAATVSAQNVSSCQFKRDSSEFRIRFKSSSSAVIPEYHNNGKVLSSFECEWKKLNFDIYTHISCIRVIGNASSDGYYASNEKLARTRADNTAAYLVRHYRINSKLLSLHIEPWLGDKTKLRGKQVLVREKTDTANRACRIIIDYSVRCPEPAAVVPAASRKSVDSTTANTVCADSAAVEPVKTVPAAIVAVSASSEPANPVTVAPVKPAPATTPAATVAPKRQTEKSEVREAPKATPIDTVRRVFGIKTNLLYDVATVANLSLEYGFNSHWAIEFLATFSPWDIRKPDFKIRTLILQPELRYYLKNGFKGHYFGLEAHLGWYNIAFPGDHTRYQDRDGNTPLWGAGVTYGYVLPFSRHWGMDFNIGLGYAKLDYDCFYNTENGAKYTSGTRNWIGPTKLGVTIYYRF